MFIRFLFLSFSVVLFLTGCSKPKPIIVGSKDTVEQRLLGEIVAQHLEHRIKSPVVRRLAAGGSPIAYQGLLNGEITLYPEYTGLIVSLHLRETPDPDASVVVERARSELRRVAMVEMMDPLGFDARDAMIVRTSGDAEKANTLSEAAAAKTPWKLGMTSEFQNRAEAMAALNGYDLEMGAPLRIMRLDQLFRSLEDGVINMVQSTQSDGHLGNPEWKALADDRKAFPPEQAVLLVRADALAAEPELRNALRELSGKISLETMRRLNAEVQLKQRAIEETAAAFLQSAGLR